MEYFLHLLTLFGILAILAMSLNLISGYAGMISLCHGAFYGIGAYALALLVIEVHIPFFISLPLAALAAAVASGLFAVWAVRARDEYFVTTTLAFQMVFLGMVNNLKVTGGPSGIAGISQPRFFSLVASSHYAQFVVVISCAAATLFVCFRLARSPYGRVLRALREDERFVRSLGRNVEWFKFTAFVTGSGLAGLAGGLYASYVTFIDPTSFTVQESLFILTSVLVGGLGSVLGPLVGAAILVGLPEGLRLLGIHSASVAICRQLIYGLALVLIARFGPRGLLGQFSLYHGDQ